MPTFERAPLSFKLHGFESAPPFKPMVTLNAVCYKCGYITRHSDVSVIDAERDMWRDRYTLLLGKLNSAIRLCHLKHGTDPIYEEFQTKMIALRDKLYGAEGEEWKK